VTLSSGTLRPNPLRNRLVSRPSEGVNFALVCSECPSTWYFASQNEALSAKSGHEDPTTLFRWVFVPTRCSSFGLMLHEHVWLELLEIAGD
jgi:hypothetical protein